MDLREPSLPSNDNAMVAEGPGPMRRPEGGVSAWVARSLSRAQPTAQVEPLPTHKRQKPPIADLACAWGV